MLSRRRAALADALGLAFILAVLLDYVRPSLLLLPTVAAGGDTPCHYPTAVWLHQHLLPKFRLHGWYPGAYLGHPLLLYYFPLPFLLMSALAPLVGMPAAFKLGSVLGVFLLPVCGYAAFRLLGFRFPGPLLAAAACLVFLFVEENPIWGGTLASTLTGEFAYAYGTGLALLFLGAVYRAYSRGRSPWRPAAALALTALAHGYAVLWAGLAASFFMYESRRPARTLRWLAAVAAGALALAAFWLLPLLQGWGWTTAYDDPWLTVAARNLLPPLLWPVFGVAALGLAATVVWGRPQGGSDRRILFLAHAALIAAGLAVAGPALGIIDVRFVPFAQLALCLVAAAWLGLLLQRAAFPEPAALGLVVLAAVHADAGSRLLRHWIEWNYTGLQAKELWPAFSELSERLRGGVGDPRVAVEYSPEHEKAGSIRMYETLPFFAGRSTLEGVYNQASLQTHAVYYLASELGATSPNPFRSRQYARFDPDAALRRLRLFHVRDVVAVSPQLVAALSARPGVTLAGRVTPYSVFRLHDEGAYVEPLAFEPVRSSPRGWREKSYRWFTRRPLPAAHLVFTDDPRFGVVERDEWLAPEAVPLPGGLEVQAEVEAETIRIRTSQPGHPLLVKVSYHPRWRAEGADGPYLVSPALMLVVPRAPEVTLHYGRNAADWTGAALTLGAVAWLPGRRYWIARRRGRGPVPSTAPVSVSVDACDLPPPRRRWGWIVPAALLLAMPLARLAEARLGPEPPDANALYEHASRAYSEGRFDDAAEYARHALGPSEGSPLFVSLLVLRGESLLRAGDAGDAAEAFEGALQRSPEGPYAAQALFGAAAARDALGQAEPAAGHRRRLLEQFAESPWAARLARAR